MKTRLLIIIGITILIAGFVAVVLFDSNTFSENNTTVKRYGEILDEINGKATIYKNNNDQEKFDEQMKLMQEKQKETASKLLKVNIFNASVIKEWNFPFRESSEVTVWDPEFNKPLCNIPEKIPVHLQKIQQSRDVSNVCQKILSAPINSGGF